MAHGSKKSALEDSVHSGGSSAVEKEAIYRIEWLERRLLLNADYHVLAEGPLYQDWADTSLLSNDDDWTNVPSILGYRGDSTTIQSGTDPRNILFPLTDSPLDINVNQLVPDTFAPGGLAEFELPDPVVALNGSNQADAPFLLVHLNTQNTQGIEVTYLLRDIDGSVDNAISPVALQFRVGETGEFTNVPEAFVADASDGPGLTKTTQVTATLPSQACDKQSVQLRIITANAAGVDEWIGIDNLVISKTTGFVSEPPTTLYPARSYTVGVDYEAAEGWSSIQHVYLRLAQSDNEDNNRLTMMWSLDTNWLGFWDNDDIYFQSLSTTKSAIANGWRVAWTFTLRSNWAPSKDVDLYAWLAHYDDAQGSQHTKQNANAIYDNNLRIFDAWRGATLVDNDHDGYYSQIGVHFDVDTGLSSNSVNVYVYRRPAGSGSGNWVANTGFYTIYGSASDDRSVQVTAPSRGNYDFGLELYGPDTLSVNTRWYGSDTDLTGVPMESVAEDTPLRLTGHVEFKGTDHLMHDAAFIKVEMYEDDYLSDDLLAVGYTDSSGHFEFSPNKGYVITNHDTDSFESGTRDIYFKLVAENDATRVKRFDVGSAYEFSGPTSNDVSGNESFQLRVEQTPVTSDHAELMGIPGIIAVARNWLQAQSGGWSRPLLEAVYPTIRGISQFDPQTDRIYIEEGDGTSYIIGHEYGHAIHFEARGRQGSLPGNGPSPHATYSKSNEAFAFTEGWGEFFGTMVEIAVEGGNAGYLLDAENGGWGYAIPAWMGTAGDWTNATGTPGSIVEGAVGSILFDLADSAETGDRASDDDGISSRFGDLWYLFLNNDPTSIWGAATTNDLYHLWVNRYGQSKAMEDIFIDQGIPVNDDAFDKSGAGNDRRENATILSNPKQAYNSLVCTDEDWYRFTLTSGSQGGSITVNLDSYYGKLNLILEDAAGQVIASQYVSTFDDRSTLILSPLSLSSGTFYIRVEGLGNDAGGSGYEGDMSPNYSLILNINSAPTNMSLTGNQVAENRPAGTAVGTLSTTDPDPGDAASAVYSIIGGDTSAFNISGSTLQTAASFNYEAKNSYTITIRTIDPAGGTFTKDFTISVINVVEQAPVFTSISSDTGASSSDRITKDRTLILNGTSEPGMLITLYRDGSTISTTNANGSGNWSFDYTGTSLADGQYSFVATARDTLGYVSNSSASYIVTIDNNPPTAGAATFNYLSGGNTISFPFGENVNNPALVAADFTVQNLGTLAYISSSNMSIAYNSGTNIATMSFPGLGGVLPDGNYRATVVSSGVTDLAGNTVTGTLQSDFWFLQADANRDRKVNTLDFNLLAGNFGGSGKVFSQGDFNYTGAVDSVDFGILVSQYGKTQPTAAAASSAGLAPQAGSPIASPFADIGVDEAKDAMVSILN